MVVLPRPVAVKLEPVVEHPFDVVERVGPVLMPRELDGAPDLLVGGVGAEVLELALEPLQLGRKARPAKQLHAGQLGEAVAEA